MGKTWVYQQYKMYIHDTVTFGGFSVELYQAINLTIGFPAAVYQIKNPAGQYITSGYTKFTGSEYVGGTQVWPSDADPQFSIRTDKISWDLLGFTKIPWVLVTLGVFSDTPPEVLGGGTTTTPPPTDVPPGPVTLPPAPVYIECVWPEFSWDISYLNNIISYISCQLRNVIVILTWIVDTFTTAVPQLLAGVTYFLSLKWITDLLDEFFTRLDVWVSEKFGIDPALPFWEELVKKAIGWLGGGIDEAAGKAIERLK